MTPNLGQVRTATIAAITRATGIAEFNYWGLAPDADFPEVGLVWPMTVDPQAGRSQWVMSVTIAVWSPALADLLARTGEILDQVNGLFGVNAPCVAEFAALGLSKGLTGPITIGTPNTSAASSSAPNLGGLWVAIQFSVQLQ